MFFLTLFLQFYFNIRILEKELSTYIIWKAVITYSQDIIHVLKHWELITARATAAPSANPCHHPCPPIIVCQRSCHPPWSIVALEACSLPWLEKSTRVPPLFHQLQLVNPTAINESMRTKVPTVNISYKSYQQERAKACIRLICMWAYVVCFVWAIGIWSIKYFYCYIAGCQHSSVLKL